MDLRVQGRRNRGRDTRIQSCLSKREKPCPSGFCFSGITTGREPMVYVHRAFGVASVESDARRAQSRLRPTDFRGFRTWNPWGFSCIRALSLVMTAFKHMRTNFVFYVHGSHRLAPVKLISRLDFFLEYIHVYVYMYTSVSSFKKKFNRCNGNLCSITTCT